MAARVRGVTFVGRLANYKFFNMDESILNAIELFDTDKNKTCSPMAETKCTS
jgi:UDP-galactopyranose mutase